MFGGFLLLGGRAGDLLGRKRLFLVGLVVFTTASLLDGLSSSEGMLIAARSLQGLGAALISPAALSIISTTFEEGAERAKALGVWAAIAIGGSAVGLVLGGALTQYLSWPWIFFVNVPVGIVAFILSFRLVPESRDVHGHRSYDIAGAVTVTGGLMALVYAIVDAQSAGWGSAKTIGTFVVAAVLLAAFVVIEQRAKAPLVRLSIFRIRSLLTANVVMFLADVGDVRDVLLQHAVHPACARVRAAEGRSRLPAVHRRDHGLGRPRLAVRAARRRPARRGDRDDPARPQRLLLLTQLPVDGSYVSNVLPAILLSSLGMGAVFMPLTLIATTGLKDEDQGLASGLFNTSQQIGGALGLAVLSTLAAIEVVVGRRLVRERARRRLPLGVRRRRGRDGARPRDAARTAPPRARGADRGTGHRAGAGSMKVP